MNLKESSLPTNNLILNPAGTWSFVGSVFGPLSYTHKDGSELEEGDPLLETAAQHGPRLAGVKVRVFRTPLEAMLAAKKLGQAIVVDQFEIDKHPEIAEGLEKSRVKHRVSGGKHANKNSSNNNARKAFEHKNSVRQAFEGALAEQQKQANANFPDDWTVTRRMNALYSGYMEDVKDALADMEPEASKSVTLIWAPPSAGYWLLVVRMKAADGSSKTFKLLPSEPRVDAGDILLILEGQL